jgi:hypothetical protein
MRLEQKLEFVQSPVVPELPLCGSNMNQFDHIMDKVLMPPAK